MTVKVSETFDPTLWADAPGSENYTDITAHLSTDGRIARIAFNRPEVRNAFRPHTVDVQPKKTFVIHSLVQI